MNVLNSIQRADLIERVSSTRYDLMVIGGGITGAGIALEAAARGIKTLLLEKGDFASGTSSKSTKLIHGGLRYLKQFELGLVREVGSERSVLHKIAPHLVRPEKMLLPMIKGGTYSKSLTSLGLLVYDILAGVKKEEQRKMLTKEQTLEMEPLLREDILLGGGAYSEYRTDDARLTIEVMKTAASMGVDVVSYAQVTEFSYKDGVLCGATWFDTLHNRQFHTYASIIVSAAGPWVDHIRKINVSLKGKRLRLTKGVHIVVPKEKLPIQQAIYFDGPDGRMIFAIPRDVITYIGTTDTDYDGNLDEVHTTVEDAHYLVNATNFIFPTMALTIDDIISSWAGLRPLISEPDKNPSELSRKDEIFVSPTGLISIAGGKLTGYRKMAQRVVDKVSKQLKKQYSMHFRRANTKNITLTGGGFAHMREVEIYTMDIAAKLAPFGLDKKANALVFNYGKQANEILDVFTNTQHENAAIRMILAEAYWCIRHEAVHTLLDFYERRTGRMYFYPEEVKLSLETVAAEFKELFSWPDEYTRRQVRTVLRQLDSVFIFEH